MKSINIKCNNLKEAKIIEQYLIKKGYYWYDDSISFTMDYGEIIIDKPIMIYNVRVNNMEITWNYFSIFEKMPGIKITEAKNLIREEKLKKINNDYGI